MLALISQLVHSIAQPSFIISVVALLIVSLIGFFVWTRLAHITIKVDQLESNQEQLQRQITHGVVLDSTPPLNLRVVPTDDMSDISNDTVVAEEESSDPIVIERTASPQEANANRELINDLYKEHSTHAMLSHAELSDAQLIPLDTLQSLKTIPEEPTEVLMSRAEVDLDDLESLDANIQSDAEAAEADIQSESDQIQVNVSEIDDMDSDLDSDISTASIQFERLNDLSRIQELHRTFFRRGILLSQILLLLKVKSVDDNIYFMSNRLKKLLINKSNEYRSNKESY